MQQNKTNFEVIRSRYAISILAHHKTYGTVQLISPEEMLKYVNIDGLSDIKHCEHLLRGWMKFVAPLTPSNVDDVPHIKCVQNAREVGYPHAVYLLLYGIAASTSCTTQLCASTIPLVRKAWPTIWVWLQYMYPVHRRVNHVIDREVHLADSACLF